MLTIACLYLHGFPLLLSLDFAGRWAWAIGDDLVPVRAGQA